MEDQKIVELYFARDESALAESERQYGTYCRSIAAGILSSSQDAEECVNDTWLHAWYAIPPQRPNKLGLFLGRITRNLSFDRYKTCHAAKRGGSEMELVLDELAECIPGSETPEDTVLAKDLSAAVNAFLRQLDRTRRSIFLRRYYYAESVEQIARSMGLTPNYTSVQLYRTRARLRTHLEQEGFL